MKITGREVRAITWMMIKYFPDELLQEMCWTSIGAVLCTFKTFITDHTWGSAGVEIRACIFKRCNDATVLWILGSPANACIMRRHYSITYKQSLHAINDLIAVGRVGNLPCGHPSYQKFSDPPPRAKFWIRHSKLALVKIINIKDVTKMRNIGKMLWKIRLSWLKKIKMVKENWRIPRK